MCFVFLTVNSDYFPKQHKLIFFFFNILLTVHLNICIS